MSARIVCFGEILLRLSAVDGELLMQSARLDARFGGAEANVGVSLSRFGHAVGMAGVLPDNGLGLAARDEIRRHGVDTRSLAVRPGRMGVYFLTPGAGPRPSQVLYDRAASAFAEHAGDIDWDQALAGAEWLHVSGVTPAIGRATADAALKAVRAASRLGVKVSMDGNYRASLWAAWDGDAPAILSELVSHAELMFGDHRDIGLILRRAFPAGAGPADLRALAAEAAFGAFPRLRLLASTDRVQHTVDHHDLTGYLAARDEAWRSAPRTVNPIVDRIGGGDAFAAGVLHGVLSGLGGQATIDFAVAAAALKHAIHGDFNLATLADVEALLADGGLDVRR